MSEVDEGHRSGCSDWHHCSCVGHLCGCTYFVLYTTPWKSEFEEISSVLYQLTSLCVPVHVCGIILMHVYIYMYTILQSGSTQDEDTSTLGMFQIMHIGTIIKALK